jgi:hypothetical protein
MIMSDIGLARMRPICAEASTRNPWPSGDGSHGVPGKIRPCPTGSIRSRHARLDRRGLVAEMTHRYLEDVGRIRQMPGVTLIEP